ncbi:MAG: response regulator transcription factor [Deltaproteobacteria bacterium]|nr:response regulator transcription factor [Deltaproteobacteria bacterium]
MKNILIADDHPIVREGLKQILSKSVDVVSVDEASNGNEALIKIGEKDYDLILLDISMPGRDGFDTLAQIRHDKPEIPVLILSMHPEEHYAKRALKSGAAGYLSKNRAQDELLIAIQRVAKGEKYITSSLAEKLAYDLERDTEEPPHEKLSNRELQVMKMIASGKSLTDIGSDLSLSIKTISTYRGRIMGKIGFKNNAELIHYVIKHGLE